MWLLRRKVNKFSIKIIHRKLSTIADKNDYNLLHSANISLHSIIQNDSHNRHPTEMQIHHIANISLWRFSNTFHSYSKCIKFDGVCIIRKHRLENSNLENFFFFYTLKPFIPFHNEFTQCSSCELYYIMLNIRLTHLYDIQYFETFFVYIDSFF